MEDFGLIGMASTCFQALIALVFIVIGAVVVRPAEERAGFMTIGIGALLFLSACCGNVPGMLLRFGLVGVGSYPTMFDCTSAIRVALALAAGGLAIAAPVSLARKLNAEREAR